MGQNMQQNNKNIFYSSLLGDLCRYIRSPRYDVERVQVGIFRKFLHIFKLWSLAITITVLLGVLASYLMEVAGVEEVKNSVVDLFQEKPVYIFLFLAVVWAPITEEITFRLGLVYSPYRLGYSLAFLAVATFSLLWGPLRGILPISLPELGVDLTEQKGIYVYIPAVVVLGYILGTLLKKKLTSATAIHFYRRHFPLIFYLSSFVFGTLHVFNFYEWEGLWFLLPLLVLPQFLLGILLAYTRMRYGMVWSVAMHFLHNGIISIPLVLLSFLPPAILSGERVLDPQELSSTESGLVSLASLFFLLILTLVLASVISLGVEYKRAKINNKITPSSF